MNSTLHASLEAAVREQVYGELLALIKSGASVPKIRFFLDKELAGLRQSRSNAQFRGPVLIELDMDSVRD